MPRELETPQPLRSCNIHLYRDDGQVLGGLYIPNYFAYIARSSRTSLLSENNVRQEYITELQPI